jgi:hypothetical protein
VGRGSLVGGDKMTVCSSKHTILLLIVVVILFNEQDG